MASIQKLPGASKNWVCSLKLSNGKRTFRSTGLPATEKNRVAAQTLCEQWQRIEDGFAPTTGNEALKFENPREVAESLITASKRLIRGEFTEADARAMLDSMLVAGRQSPIANETTRQIFENWMRGKTLSKSDRTADRYKTVVKLFLKHLADRADRPLSALTIRDIEGFRDARLEKKLSSRTVSVDIKIIRGVLEGARRQGVLLHNPAQGCELPRGRSKERETFTPEEVSKLIAAASVEWKTAIMLGYYLGARLEDAVTVNWEMLAPYKGRVYDPACGSGGMFVQSEKFVEEHGGHRGDISIHHLAPSGMAGFVLANGSMSSNQSGEGDIRRAIIEADLVDCMVAMPGQLFYSTQIPVCLWFLTRSKSADGKRGFRDRRKSTLFIDARKLGILIDRVHRELTDEDIAKIADTYHAWRGNKSTGCYEDIPGFCKSATTEEIAGHAHKRDRLLLSVQTD